MRRRRSSEEVTSEQFSDGHSTDRVQLFRQENMSVRVVCLLPLEEEAEEVFVVFVEDLLGVWELLASSFPRRFWRRR